MCGAALLATATVLAFLVWLENPYTALLLIVPLHVWLVALTREHTHSPRSGALALLASLAAPLAAFALICVSLAVSPFELLWTLVMLVAGGALSFGGLLLGSVACACFVAAGLLLLRPGTPHAELEITVRGPLRYAGPGSLGGTESALHR